MACRFHGGPGALRHAPRRPARSRVSSPARPRPAASSSPWRSASSVAPVSSSWQAPPEPPPVRPVRRPRLRTHERERVQVAADFCADVVADSSWEQAVSDRLTDRAGDTWKRLTRSRRRRNCKKLAQMARTILKTKDQVHQIAAELASQAASVAGVRGAALDFHGRASQAHPHRPGRCQADRGGARHPDGRYRAMPHRGTPFDQVRLFH